MNGSKPLIAGLRPFILPWGVLLEQLDAFANTSFYASPRAVLELFPGQKFVSSQSAHHKSNLRSR
jgi:hypothetical protein